MILYYFEHPSQLFKMLVHKMTLHKNDSATFIICDVSYNNAPVSELERKKSKFGIDQIIKFPHSNNWISSENLNELKKRIVDTCEILLKKHSININEIEKIYVGRDSGVCFENYLLSVNIPYTHFETGDVIATKHIGDSSLQIYELYTELILKLGNNNVDLLTTVPSRECSYYRNTMHFDIVNATRELPEAVSLSIYSIFGASDLLNLVKKGYFKNSTIFAPNSSYDICVKKGKTKKEAILANELLLDYFCPEDNVVFKPHPLFNFDLTKNGQPIRTIPADVSIDILKTMPNFHAKRLITVASQSAEEMKEYVDKVVKLEWAYNTFFVLLHKYYTVFELITSLWDGDGPTEVAYSGQFPNQLKCLVECRFQNKVRIKPFVLSKLSSLENRIIIVEELMWDEINNTQEKYLQSLVRSSSKIIFFVPHNSELSFVNNHFVEYLEHIIPINIVKSNLRDRICCSQDYEMVYVYLKDKNKMELIRNRTVYSKLLYSGIELEASIADGVVKKRYDDRVREEIYRENIEDSIRAVQKMLIKQDNALVNPNFLTGFRSNYFVVGSSFQLICDGWNTHTSDGGSFIIKKMKAGIEVAIRTRGSWNNIEQWVDLKDIQYLVGKKIRFSIQFNSPTQDVRTMYVVCRPNEEAPVRLLTNEIKKIEPSIDSEPFTIPPGIQGKIVFGISMVEKKGGRCQIKSASVSPLNSP